jgi:uncharacterized protein (DUF1015 family)
MADIIPFRGTRYCPSEAGDISTLVSPPYDVIDAQMRHVLFGLSDYNIARIIKADRQDGDAPYAPAAALWRSWREAGIVGRDPAPAVYVYEQRFEVDEHRFVRTGIIALVRIEEAGGVLPHETTLSGPRADRLELLRATQTQFGLVFGLYADPERRIDRLLESAKDAAPLAHACERQKECNRLWALTDPDALRDIQAAMADKELLIADGHHRYETALAYRRDHPDWPAAGYRMMALVNTADEGLVILPTHRLVKGLADFDAGAFLARLRRDFDVRTYPGRGEAVREALLDALHAARSEGRHAFGLDVGDGNHYLLTLHSLESMADLPDRSETWRSLDVAILHHVILDKALGITAERLAAQAHLSYIHDFAHARRAAAERVSRGEAQALLFLNPTRIDEVISVARKGERMPQKSTFFYPKVVTGLVMNCLNDSLEA